MWYFKSFLLLVISLITINVCGQKVIFHPNKMNIDRAVLSISGIYFEINLTDSTIFESYENYSNKSKMYYHLEKGIIHINYDSKDILFKLLCIDDNENYSKLIYRNKKGDYDFHLTGKIEIILRDE